MSHRSVLIMEDDLHLLRLFSKTLSKADYTVYDASTVNLARQFLKAMPFSVMICDMRMGSESGIDLLKEMMPQLMQHNTRIIVVSAEEQYRTACEDLGVEFFLSKPISPAMLVALVRRLTVTTVGMGMAIWGSGLPTFYL